jgi:hypothetical protein
MSYAHAILLFNLLGKKHEMYNIYVNSIIAGLLQECGLLILGKSLSDRLKAEIMLSVPYFLILIEVTSLRNWIITFGNCCINSDDFG